MIVSGGLPRTFSPQTPSNHSSSFPNEFFFSLLDLAVECLCVPNYAHTHLADTFTVYKKHPLIPRTSFALGNKDNGEKRGRKE